MAMDSSVLDGGLVAPEPPVRREVHDRWSRNRAGGALVFGLCGGTSSGKTTFARGLIERLGQLDGSLHPVLLRQDEYFQDYLHLPEEARNAARTANRPDAIAWPSLRDALEHLRAGRSVTFPGQGTGLAQRDPNVREIGPTRLVIVEGHLLYVDAPMQAMIDLKAFLDCDPEERVLRRIRRDTTTSGRTIEQSLEWYLRDVQPNNRHYVEWQRAHADLVIPHDRENPSAVAFVADAILGRLARA
jgi:uridine kinase